MNRSTGVIRTHAGQSFDGHVRVDCCPVGLMVHLADNFEISISAFCDTTNISDL